MGCERTQSHSHDLTNRDRIVAYRRRMSRQEAAKPSTPEVGLWQIRHGQGDTVQRCLIPTFERYGRQIRSRRFNRTSLSPSPTGCTFRAAFRGCPVAVRPALTDGIFDIYFCHKKITHLGLTLADQEL